MKNIKFLLIILLAGVVFSACKTLKAVNDVSTAASTDLQQFDQFNTSLTGIYVDDLRQRTYGGFSETTIALRTDTPATTNLFPMSLAEAKQKDTLLRKIYTALHGYFAALAKLSADSLVNYTVDTVTTYLSGGSIIDTSKVSAGTISAIGSIATKLGEFVSNGYRLHHIKQYVVESDPFVQRLTSDMKESLRAMRIFLMTEQRFLKDSVYKSLVKTSTSAFERKEVTDQYYRVTADLTNRAQRLTNYIASLDIIAAGHAYISAHVDELRSDKVRTDLTHYASLLKDRHSEFNALTQRTTN